MWGYVSAVVSVLVVWGTRSAMEFVINGQAPFVMFALSVVVASTIGGFGPGMVAVVLSIGVNYAFFLGPAGVGRGGSPAELLAMTLFFVQGIGISLLGGSRRRTVAALRAERAELSVRVEERTRELSSANEQLTRSNRELESFASVASHDLQEPLRKILAFGDRLKTQAGSALGADAADSLSRMQNAARRMQTLINDLLTFSRVGSRAQSVVRVRLDAIVTDVLVDLETRLEEASGRVTFEGLPEIEADPLQMRQLFQNLIANGIKFHRPGVAPVVRIVGTVDGGQVMIDVIDNGIGFEPQFEERIFGIFQRLHGRAAYEGTGIGLAVCRRIAERHGGSITAFGRPGEGATFSIRLPLEQTS